MTHKMQAIIKLSDLYTNSESQAEILANSDEILQSLK